MARPRKDGLDYFPFDVNLDYKWEAVEACHGNDGFTACVKLFQECYKSDCGEINYSVVIRRKTLEKKLNFGEELLRNIIETAVEVELFDKTAWNERQIITSNGIKKRIDSVSKERKNARKRSETSSSPEKLPNNTRINSEEVHKEKNSIVKKSKEENIEKEVFDIARKIFPGTKRGVDTEWENFKKKNKDYAQIVGKLKLAIEKEITHKRHLKKNNLFCAEWKNFQTWINNKCWEQEFTKIEAKKTSNQFNGIFSEEPQPIC